MNTDAHTRSFILSRKFVVNERDIVRRRFKFRSQTECESRERLLPKLGRRNFDSSLIRKRSYLGISLGSRLLTLDTSVVTSPLSVGPCPFRTPFANAVTLSLSLSLSHRDSTNETRVGRESFSRANISQASTVCRSAEQIGTTKAQPLLFFATSFGKVESVLESLW